MGTAVVDETGVVPAGTWKSDRVHSWVGFQMRHMAVSNYRGELPSFDVTVTSDGRQATLEGSAPVESIVTRDENLTAHIGASDFLDGERHPEITLTSTALERGPYGELIADGTLTMKGISKPVRLVGKISDATDDPFGMTRLGIELEGVVDRRDFDMSWQAPLPGGGLALGYEVTVSAQIELVRQ